MNLSMVRIERGDKEIIIYVQDGFWNSIPDLSFIEDIEIYEKKPRFNKGEKDKA